MLLIDNQADSGTMVMAITGRVELHGLSPITTWTRLT